MLSNGATLTIFYSPHPERTLLRFRDIRENNYHAETTEENCLEYLCINSYEYPRSIFMRRWNASRMAYMLQLFEPHRPCGRPGARVSERFLALVQLFRRFRKRCDAPYHQSISRASSYPKFENHWWTSIMSILLFREVEYSILKCKDYSRLTTNSFVACGI